MANGLVPEWIDSLMTTTFFTQCLVHQNLGRKACNVFCTDCPQAGALCAICRSTSHVDHNSIQIRKSSSENTVNISEVRSLLDVSDVQPCISKGARVLYIANGINEAKQNSICVVCLKQIVNQEYQFCSLSCKLERVKSVGDCCLVVDEADRLAEIYFTERRRRRRRTNADGHGVDVASTSGAGGEDMVESSEAPALQEPEPNHAPLGSWRKKPRTRREPDV